MAKPNNTPEAGIDDLGGLAAAAAPSPEKGPTPPADASSTPEAAKDTKPAADASPAPVEPQKPPVVDPTAPPAADPTASIPAEAPAGAKPEHPAKGEVVRDWELTESRYEKETGTFTAVERRLVASDDEGARDWEYRDKPAVG